MFKVNEEMQMANLVWFYVLCDMCLVALHSKTCPIIRKILKAEVVEIFQQSPLNQKS